MSLIYALTSRTAPPPLLISAPNFPSIARATCETIGRVSALLYFMADVSLWPLHPCSKGLGCTSRRLAPLLGGSGEMRPRTRRYA